MCAGLRRRPFHSRAWLAGAALAGACSNGTAARLRAAQWLDSSAEQEVGVPVEAAYAMWEDRTRIPQWMPWITSVTVSAACFFYPLAFPATWVCVMSAVLMASGLAHCMIWQMQSMACSKLPGGMHARGGFCPGRMGVLSALVHAWRQVLPEDARLSRWVLSTEQLGRRWEFSWLAQNLTPTKLQKIHWRSVQARAWRAARQFLQPECLLHWAGKTSYHPLIALIKGQSCPRTEQRWLTACLYLGAAGLDGRQPGQRHRHRQPRPDQVLPQGPRRLLRQAHHLLRGAVEVFLLQIACLVYRHD